MTLSNSSFSDSYLDHYIFDYLVHRGLSSLASEFLASIRSSGGSRAVPDALLYKWWNNSCTDFLKSIAVHVPANSSNGSSAEESENLLSSKRSEPDQGVDKLQDGRLPCRFPGCQKTFTNPSNRLRHERLHSGVKPFVCDYKHDGVICGKSFARKSDLQTHLKTHTKEKPFPCSICGKAFARSSDLRCHERIHESKKDNIREKDLDSNSNSNSEDSRKSQRKEWSTPVLNSISAESCKTTCDDSQLSSDHCDSLNYMCSNALDHLHGHIHTADCGHSLVFHDDHFDFLVNGRLHHPHETHCDDHGIFSMLSIPQENSPPFSFKTPKSNHPP